MNYRKQQAQRWSDYMDAIFRRARFIVDPAFDDGEIVYINVRVPEHNYRSEPQWLR